jgi:hypothetical protein
MSVAFSTAKNRRTCLWTLGITVPPALLSTADEVIE